MAEEIRQVRYDFSGDVSALKTAASEAINLLSQFGDAFRQASQSGSMKASSEAQREFQKSIADTTKQFTAMLTQLNKADKTGITSLPGQVSTLQTELRNLTEIFNYMHQGTILQSDDLKLLSSVLQDTKTNVNQASTQVNAATVSFKTMQDEVKKTTAKIEEMGTAAKESTDETKKLMDEATQPTEAPGEDTRTFAEKVSESFQAAADNAAKFTMGLGEVTGAANEAGTATSNASSKTSDFTQASKMSKDALLDLALLGFDPLTQAVIKLSVKMSDLTSTALKTWAEKTIQLIAGIIGVTGKLSISLLDVRTSFNGFVEFLSGAALGNALSNAVKESLNFVENMNLFNVAMGESVVTGRNFLTVFQEIYGLDPSNIAKTTGIFYQLTAAMEAPTEASRIMSMGLTKAAIDLSSLFNVDFETVANDLTSGMQGMSRSVRKYAMDIRQTTLQQLALSLGMEGNIGKMSETNRQGLRYLAMMRQMQNVNGDFTRTIESGANQLRVFKEQVSQLARSIGNFLMPVLQVILPYVNGLVMALRAVLETIAAFMGIEIAPVLPENASGSIDTFEDIGDAASGAAKDLKKLVAPWDQLNLLAEETAKSAGSGLGSNATIGALDPKLLEQIKVFENSLTEVRMKANDVRDSLLEAFGFKWVTSVDIDTGEITRKLEIIPGSVADTIAKAVASGDWYKVGEAAAQFASSGLNKAIEFLSNSGLQLKILEVVTNITNTIRGFFETYPWEDLGRVLGLGFNVVMRGLQEFLISMPWSSIGASVATLLNNTLSTIDWTETGKTFTAGINGVFSLIYSFLEGFNFKAAADDLVTFLNSAMQNTNWELIGQTFNLALKGALDFLHVAIDKFDWWGLGNNLGQMLGSVDWLGVLASAAWAIIKGLFGGLLAAISALVSTFVNGIKNFFIGIGDNIRNFFMNGFTGDNGEKLKNDLETKFKEPFSKTAREITDTFTNSGEQTRKGFSGKFGQITSDAKTNVVDPLKENASDVAGSWATAGDNAYKDFMLNINALPKNVNSSIADPIMQTAKALQGGIGGVGYDASLQFFNGMQKLPGQVQEEVTSPIAVDFDKLGVNAGLVALSVNKEFQNTLAPMPSWVSTNITNPITVLFVTMGTVIENVLTKIIDQTNKAIQSAKTLQSVTSVSSITVNTKTTGVPSAPDKKMATGGVVTRRITMGEGLYDEAIIPLGNSPQMEQLLQRFADIAGKNNGQSSESLMVKVYIGDKEWDAFTYKSAQRGQKIVGAQPNRVGG